MTLVTSPENTPQTEGAATAEQAVETPTSLLSSGATAVDGEEQPTAEEQPAGEQTAEGADKVPAEAEGKEPEGAPEAYEFAAPEGFDFGDAVITAYSEVAKELNLTQAAAQKVLDKVAPALQQQNAATISAIREEWVAASTADKEFGGDSLKANLGIASKALDALGTPELRALLNETGLGNHPEVIRVLYRAGQRLSQDSFVTGSGRAAKETDPAKVLFPDMN